MTMQTPTLREQVEAFENLFEDPAHPLNGQEYRTGKLCIEGCGREAGTYWSPHWCQPCNAARMLYIRTALIRTLA